MMNSDIGDGSEWVISCILFGGVLFSLEGSQRKVPNHCTRVFLHVHYLACSLDARNAFAAPLPVADTNCMLPTDVQKRTLSSISLPPLDSQMRAAALVCRGVTLCSWRTNPLFCAHNRFYNRS